MGDDIGYWNVSAYNQGMMGYETPNIDRIAKEGMLFTHAYGEQSCTAGRASFMTGQIGLPHRPVEGRAARCAKEGMPKKDPTIAEYMKSKGYMTGQFGKNHLGDRDEHLPTNHGFDEFFGNLYHLNAEEEPENVDYPKDPEFREKFGPRGVIKSSADGSVRRHRPADPQAHGNDRRGSHRRGAGLHGPRGGAEQAVSSCGTTRRACTSSPTSSRRARA